MRPHNLDKYEKVKIIQNLAKNAEEPTELQHLDDAFSIAVKYFEIFQRDLEPDVIVKDE